MAKDNPLLLFWSNPIFRSTAHSGSRRLSFSGSRAGARQYRPQYRPRESLVRSCAGGRADGGGRPRPRRQARRRENIGSGGGRIAAQEEFVSRPLHLGKEERRDERTNERTSERERWMDETRWQPLPPPPAWLVGRRCRRPSSFDCPFRLPFPPSPVLILPIRGPFQFNMPRSAAGLGPPRLFTFCLSSARVFPKVP